MESVILAAPAVSIFRPRGCMFPPRSLLTMLETPQPVIRLYAVPLSAFTAEDDEDDAILEVDEPESS